MPDMDTVKFVRNDTQGHLRNSPLWEESGEFG